MRVGLTKVVLLPWRDQESVSYSEREVKSVNGTVLSRRLAAGLGALGGGRPIQGVCRGWRLAVR
ncbi:hypothetical protein DEO72_LG3g1668 [Vigna unguiculata]|uniref:Uncharacterized protein n=1 Tax=Vigna unguiculata TaxID=3917 RepID=A0A4D6LFN2_VIGUN|nr:hypothetical protein DEO72_LG3g1668 [Vigna unguiculata]